MSKHWKTGVWVSGFALAVILFPGIIKFVFIFMQAMFMMFASILLDAVFTAIFFGIPLIAIVLALQYWPKKFFGS